MALAIVGSDAARGVVFDPPHLLAPMEGVTDPLFRGRVIALGGVGGACTEFLRVSSGPLPARVIRRHLGPPAGRCPVGAQIMAPDARHVAASAAAAERAGAAYVDLNFGCPAPVVFKKCAGSALLADPPAIARIVREARGATGLPVTAKVRAGIDGAGRLREILHAAAEAGAAAITLHARLRTQTYAEPATWAWIAEAKAFLVSAGFGATPLVGNGGAERPEDLARMRAETGCDGVMVGRGAIRDPWIFARALGAPPATAAEAARFALEYAAAIEARSGERAALTKLKQLVRWYDAGGSIAGEDERRGLLRAQNYDDLRAHFERLIPDRDLVEAIRRSAASAEERVQPHLIAAREPDVH